LSDGNAASREEPGYSRASLNEAGFTLIEILLTLLIFAILTGAAAMSLGGPHDRDAEAAVLRLRSRLQYAVDDALIGERTIALIPDERKGYRFVAWNPAKADWSADPGPELANDGGKDSRVELAGFGPGGAVRFRPGGESDAFALVLTSGDRVWRIRCDGINVALDTPRDQ
jgi:type II secretion system protein H